MLSNTASHMEHRKEKRIDIEKNSSSIYRIFLFRNSPFFDSPSLILVQENPLIRDEDFVFFQIIDFPQALYTCAVGAGNIEQGVSFLYDIYSAYLVLLLCRNISIVALWIISSSGSIVRIVIGRWLFAAGRGRRRTLYGRAVQEVRGVAKLLFRALAAQLII